MNEEILLPVEGSSLERYRLRGKPAARPPAKPFASRIAFAAAHVTADPFVNDSDVKTPIIDWDATLAYRRHLWSYGFSVAEAMDTAQRGMGLDWDGTKELIRRSLAEAKAVGGGIACGAGTDQLDLTAPLALADVKRAYAEQCEFIESHGGRIILMASRALAACAQSPDDYFCVYDEILSQVSRPVILHWLGEMFDPALQGYWGYRDPEQAMQVVLQIIRKHAGKIDGIKISLLDAEREIRMRRLLPSNVKMYTGDDFHYPELIEGDETGYSHALLGIFDAIAPVASAALQALDGGDKLAYRSLMQPTVALSRHIFQKPTYNYKTGIVFLAYLNGHQHHFRMIGGKESARSVLHLSELFRLAYRAFIDIFIKPYQSHKEMSSS